MALQERAKAQLSRVPVGPDPALSPHSSLEAAIRTPPAPARSEPPLIRSHLYMSPAVNHTDNNTSYHAHITCLWPDFSRLGPKKPPDNSDWRDGTKASVFNETSGRFPAVSVERRRRRDLWQEASTLQAVYVETKLGDISETLGQFPAAMVVTKKKQTDIWQEVGTWAAVFVAAKLGGFN